MSKQTVKESRTTAVDSEKLNRFIGQFVTDFGAAMHAPTIIIGEKLGLYKAMAGGAELTSQELASKTGTSERYVREWLSAQAASGYVMYNHLSGKFWLSPEQAFTLADESSPAYLPGAFYIASAVAKDEPKLEDAFRTGKGVGWHEHDGNLFRGTEMFFRPGYSANLVSSWLPALEGVVAKLEKGARVADIGCGHGASTIIMAKAYPKSTFIGYDYHGPSIEVARETAKREGVDDRVTFEVASAKTYPGRDFDLVAVFDALHDMGDPAGAAAHVRQSLKPDGTWLIVEPYANERLEENLNPVGRIFYSASTMLCTGGSLDQEVGVALGAQAPESSIRELVMRGGFTRFRRATQTPFNRVFEAKP
ncbi:MAG: class I SAM-dependent methyltransferase [Thaumarchaeota archaeon]|nr:class I SAM-dependent methyltransferase [Nitrososphaerota archaeon]